MYWYWYYWYQYDTFTSYIISLSVPYQYGFQYRYWYWYLYGWLSNIGIRISIGISISIGMKVLPRAHSIAWQASACALNGKERKCAHQMVTTCLKIKGWIWTSNRSKKNLLPIIPEPSLFKFNVLPLNSSVHYYLSAWSLC